MIENNMIEGFATSQGTKNFSQTQSFALPQNYKIFDSLTLSNVGIGTYLGEPDDVTDKLVVDAIKLSIKSGINVIDTAINYRTQKAERSVGVAISELNDQGISREGLFVCTKNGYVTNDAAISADFWQYVQNYLVKPGIIKAGDISSGYHCMTVPFLQDQLNQSLKNLNLECIDLIYLHNPAEGQLQDVSKNQFLNNLQDVFEFYEQQRKEGKIRYYGLATWECFRVNRDHPLYLSLAEITEIAQKVGGTNHGFKFIQLPYNLYLDQAYMNKNQQIDDKQMTILEAANHLGIGVFSSVPLMQGRLLQNGVLPEFENLIPSHRCLQFVRSTPGILAPLVGQKSPEHVKENLKIMKIPPLSEDKFYNLVKKLVSH